MANTLELATKITITPTAGSATEESLSFTSTVPPVDIVKNQVVVGTTSFSIDFGNIAAGSGFVIWLYAIVGNFYFKLNSASGDPILTDSHLYIREGEAFPVPINPNVTALANGIRGKSDSATGKLEYLLVSK
jgi:predicted membrane-bound dolichyl-phosphate-mannose-protein mannosyltransferase